MSGQWEVVGKKKDKTSKLPVPKNNNAITTKKPVNKVKIDEILPKSQVQNLYNTTKSNKENKKPNEKAKNQESNAKKVQKKEKTQEPIKPKPPKSIESALNAIDLKEFENLFENSHNHFPEAPIIWLKELVQFLNQKIPIEVQDPTFSAKKDGYPLSMVPSGIKNIIEKAISQAGKNNTQLFFDICLTSMTSDMSKDLPALGNKIFLQYIATTEPLIVSANINKYITLKNSYQNRPNIGLSILWSVGHVGVNDFQCGLEVFQKLFLPLLEMKNYSRYVASYLSKLLTQKDNIAITKEQYLLLLDAVYSNKKNFPSDLKQDLSNKLSMVMPLLFKNKKEKYSNFFELVFKKILVNSDKSYQDCLCDILINIFHEDKTTLTNWSKIYSKNVATSAILLKYLGDNWKTISKKIPKTAINELLESLKLINVELSQKKNILGLKEAVASIKTLNEKMVAKEHSTSSFKIFFITCFLLSQFVIVGILIQNIQNKWDDSVFNELLKSAPFKYLQQAASFIGEGIGWVDVQLEDSFPGYKKVITDVTEPYVTLFIKFGKFLINVAQNLIQYGIEKYPLMLQNIEYYLPGLVENSQKVISNTYSTSAFYFNSSVDYLKQNVFVGQLSPDNVQKVVLDALNSTQQKASEYYFWIYEKVQTTIK